MGRRASLLLLLVAPSVLGQSCSSNDDCTSGACGYSSVNGSADKVCCSDGVSRYVSRNEYGFTSGGSRYFCTGLSNSQFCREFDEVCSSGSCVLETCQAQKLDSNEVCMINNDCSSGACGYGAVDGTADVVCCGSGDRVGSYISRNEYGFTSGGTRQFCTAQPDGTKCGDIDEVCSSGSCVLETCQAQKLDSNEVCKINNDCSSGACGYGAVDGTADVVCCESGNRFSSYISRNEYGFTSGGSRNFCTAQKDGTKMCGDLDETCESGYCVKGLCQAQRLDDNELCSINNDCSSSACGYSAVDGTADLVCCSSGELFREYVSRNEYGFTSGGSMDFCTAQPDGTKCGELQEACSSSNCICGVCEEAVFECFTGICGPDGCLEELLPPGDPCIADDNCVLGECGQDGTCSYLEDSVPCTEGEDDQCSSQVCSRDKATQDASFVCCPSGEKLTDGDSSLSVCTQTGIVGDPCFDDSICKSGICVDSMCKGGLQKEELACEKAEHCHSGSCYASKCSPFPTLEERNSYYNDRAVCPIDELDNANRGGYISLVVYGDSTSRSWSSDFLTEFRDEDKDPTGTENILEGQKVLDALAGCADGSSIVAQRQGDSVCFSYQFQDIGDDGAVSSCKTKCIRIGSSGSFETYDKFTTSIVGGLFGVPVTAYYFGDSRECRVDVSMENAGPPASAQNDAISGPNSEDVSGPNEEENSSSQSANESEQNLSSSNSEEGNSSPPAKEPDQDDNEENQSIPSDKQDDQDVNEEALSSSNSDTNHAPQRHVSWLSDFMLFSMICMQFL